MKKFIVLIIIGVISFVVSCEKVNQVAVNAVRNQIDTLPEIVEYKDKDLVEIIKLKYDDLNSAEKKLITNHQKLVDAVDRIAFLETLSVDEELVNEVKDLIDKIPNNISLSDKIYIYNTKIKYDILNDREKELVDVGKLEEAIKKIEYLESLTVDEIQVMIVIAYIDSLPSVITLANKDVVMLVLSFFNQLNELEKSLVTNSQKLFEAVDRIDLLENTPIDQIKVNEVIGLINSLPNIINLNFETDLKNIENKYSALNVLEKPLVINYNVYNAAMSIIEQLKDPNINIDLVLEVVDKVNNLPESSEVKLTDQNKINDAYDSYLILEEKEKFYFDYQYNVLSAKLIAVRNALNTLINDTQKAKEVNDLLAVINNSVEFEDLIILREIIDKYDRLSSNAKQLVNNTTLIDNIRVRLPHFEIARKVADELDYMIPTTIEDPTRIEIPRRIYIGDDEYRVEYYANSALLQLTSLLGYGWVYPGRTDRIDTLYIRINTIGTTIINYSIDIESFGIPLLPLPDRQLVFAYNWTGANTLIKGSPGEDIVDVMNIAFGTIANDPHRVATVPSNSVQYMDGVALRNKGVRMVLSFSGYGAAGAVWSNAAFTEDGRKEIAASLVKCIIDYEFDGVDIDWEYPGYETGRPTSVDSPNYTLLMQEIYTQVKAANPNYIVSAAVPGGPYTPPRYEIDKVNNYLDFFHLMTYDLDSADRGSHHTALYGRSNATASGCSVHETVNYYLSRGASKSKLIVGAAFYGRYTVVSSVTNDGFWQSITAGSRRSAQYNEIKTLVDKANGTTQRELWDDVCKAPYYLDTINRIFITYDNPTSIGLKCDYVIANQLGGIMMWAYGQDASGTLISAMGGKFK